MKEKHREESYICIISITVTTIIFQAAAETFSKVISQMKNKKKPTQSFIP